MTQETLMDVRRAGDDTGVIEISGDITAASEDALMDAYGRAGDGDTRAVLLDFSRLEYMNSGGIGLLVTLLVRAQRAKQRLLACGLNDHYRQIFELTRLDEAITIYDDEAAALAAAASLSIGFAQLSSLRLVACSVCLVITAQLPTAASAAASSEWIEIASSRRVSS